MTGRLRIQRLTLIVLLAIALVAIAGATSQATMAKGAPAQFASGGLADTLFDGNPWPGIDQGDVTPAGNSGRFVVKDRTVTGALTAIIPGSPEGRFEFNFGTNVPLLTQSGQIHGILSIAGGEIEAKVSARSTLQGFTELGLPVIAISGKLTFTSGATGTGEIGGVIIPVLDPSTLHIVGLAYGELGIVGQWHQ